MKEYNYNDKVENCIKLYDSIDKKEGYSSFIIEDAYRSEIENFFEVIEGTDVAKYSFEKDLRILSMINKIEGKEDFNYDTK